MMMMSIELEVVGVTDARGRIRYLVRFLCTKLDVSGMDVSVTNSAHHEHGLGDSSLLLFSVRWAGWIRCFVTGWWIAFFVSCNVAPVDTIIIQLVGAEFSCVRSYDT